ncbi:hypothetical protein V8E36_002255 [Tilletia maclaganii]
MSSSTPISLDHSLIPPSAKYAPIYSDALGDGPIDTGRNLFLLDPVSAPSTLFEARTLMSHSGKTVGTALVGQHCHQLPACVLGSAPTFRATSAPPPHFPPQPI